jgi:Glyoxalase superfamily protein
MLCAALQRYRTSASKVTASQSLELIAQTFGVADWNTLFAAIRPELAATLEQSCSFCGKSKHEVRSLCEEAARARSVCLGVAFSSAMNASHSARRSMPTCCYPDRA